jgi:uncharacterized RDD family membrane protein YckC
MKYSGFWKRFVAAFIDGIILYIIAALIGLIFGLLYATALKTTEGVEAISFILGTVTGWLYYALMESSCQQATLGKQAMGIIVTELNNNRISFARATGRYFAKIISGMILLVGYIMAAFTEKKQALHDIIASPLVISKR